MASFESHVYFRTATLSTSQWESSPQCTAVIKLKKVIITPDPKHTPTDKESGCLFITQNVPTANETFSNPVTSSWNPTTEKWRRKIDVRQKHMATKSCAARLTFMYFFGLMMALSDDLRNTIDISSSIVIVQTWWKIDGDLQNQWEMLIWWSKSYVGNVCIAMKMIKLVLFCANPLKFSHTSDFQTTLQAAKACLMFDVCVPKFEIFRFFLLRKNDYRLIFVIYCIFACTAYMVNC